MSELRRYVNKEGFIVKRQLCSCAAAGPGEGLGRCPRQGARATCTSAKPDSRHKAPGSSQRL